MKKIIKKFTIDRNVRVGYGTAFFLLLLSYLLTLYVNRQLLKEARLVDHTNRVLTHLESILSNVKDAETGSRGYFIMKDMRFLDPYFPSRSKVDSIYKLLKGELSDNLLQVNRLDTLRHLIDNRFLVLQENITRFQSNNFELTDSLKAEGYNGKQRMDDIRSLVLRMQLHEEALLKGREAQMHGQYNALNTVVITSLVLALILAIYGFFTYTRENIARRKADQKVFEYQEELKDRINELDKANKELVRMRSIEKLAATGRIARTIAHEVRNPLTNINLSVDQLRSEVEESSEGVFSLFDMIARNSTN